MSVFGCHHDPLSVQAVTFGQSVSRPGGRLFSAEQLSALQRLPVEIWPGWTVDRTERKKKRQYSNRCSSAHSFRLFYAAPGPNPLHCSPCTLCGPAAASRVVPPPLRGFLVDRKYLVGALSSGPVPQLSLTHCTSSFFDSAEGTAGAQLVSRPMRRPTQAYQLLSFVSRPLGKVARREPGPKH